METKPCQWTVNGPFRSLGLSRLSRDLFASDRPAAAGTQFVCPPDKQTCSRLWRTTRSAVSYGGKEGYLPIVTDISINVEN